MNQERTTEKRQPKMTLSEIETGLSGRNDATLLTLSQRWSKLTRSIIANINTLSSICLLTLFWSLLHFQPWVASQVN